MLTVLQQVIILFIFALAGYILCRAGLADASHSKLLATLEVYIFLPCTIFKTFSNNCTREYISKEYAMILIAAAVLAVIITAAFFTSRLITKDSYTRRVYQYSLIVPNSGYMGYALAQSLYGDAAMLNAMIFAIPVSLYTYSVGFCLLTKSKLNLKKLIHPVIIAVIVGCAVGLSGLKMPTIATSILDKASACMAPISMIITGMTISQFRIRDLLSDKRAYLVTALRLIVIPVAVALALKPFCDEYIVRSALLIFAMPCGLNTIVFPKLVGEDCRPGAALACLSTTGAIITIPLCLTLLL